MTQKYSRHFTGAAWNDLAVVSHLIVDAQDLMNATVDKEWRTRAFPFFRAASAEINEAFGYTSWEWWKNLDNNFHDVFRKEEDIAEFHMELVDALHFLVSAHVQVYLGDGREVIDAYALPNAGQDLARAFDLAFTRHRSDGNSYIDRERENDDLESGVKGPEQTLRRIERLQYALLDRDLQKSFDMLVELAEHTGLGLQGLIGRYFAKNTLNIFRAANGYKEKTYIKLWGDGKEDNYYLNQLAIPQLAGLGFPELLVALRNGTWQDALFTELDGLYLNVLRTGHAYHVAVEAAANQEQDNCEAAVAPVALKLASVEIPACSPAHGNESGHE